MQKELPATRDRRTADVDDREARLDARERRLERRESAQAGRDQRERSLLVNADRRDDKPDQTTGRGTARH
jgi:hypothetical protein